MRIARLYCIVLHFRVARVGDIERAGGLGRGTSSRAVAGIKCTLKHVYVATHFCVLLHIYDNDSVHIYIYIFLGIKQATGFRFSNSRASQELLALLTRGTCISFKAD